MTPGDHGEIVPVRLPPRRDTPAWLARPADAALPGARTPPGVADGVAADGAWSRAHAAPRPGTPWHTPMPPVRVELLEAPAAIVAASWLWIGSAALHVGSWLLAAFVDVPLVAIDMHGVPGEQPDGASVAAAITVLALGVLWSLVYAVPATILGVLLRRGRGPLRVVLTVAGVLMLGVLAVEAFAGWAWRSGHPGATGDVWLEYRAIAGLSAAAAGAIVTATVLMHTASARRFAAAARAARS